MTADAGTLKGTYTSVRFGSHEAKDIKLDGSSLSWTVEFQRDGKAVKGTYKGQLEAGTAPGAIKGTLALEANGKTTSLDFTGERNGAKTAAAQKDEVTREARKPQSDFKREARPTGNKSTSLPPAPAKGRVIVMLKSRNEILVVYSSTAEAKGPTFAIRSTEGKEIAPAVSLKELQASYPQIYEVYRTSFADLSAGIDQAHTGRLGCDQSVTQKAKVRDYLSGCRFRLRMTRRSERRQFNFDGWGGRLVRPFLFALFVRERRPQRCVRGFPSSRPRRTANRSNTAWRGDP